MMDQECARWQGELAMQALGRLEPDVAVGLQAHLDGCADCRAEAAALRPLAGALALASVDSLDEVGLESVPPQLQASVMRRLTQESRSEHRRSRRRMAGAVAAVAAVAAAAVVAVVALTSVSPPPAGRVVALSGAPGTVASITLTRSSTGTDVTLREHGQPIGRNYVVTMESAGGTWWQAGSYHTTGTTARADLTCAVEPSQITRVWVRDSTGATVLSAYLP
jgi:hypothetical protein